MSIHLVHLRDRAFPAGLWHLVSGLSGEAGLARVVKALSDFGGPAAEAKHLNQAGSVFRMGSPPLQIDIINQAANLQFDECYSRRSLVVVDDLEISVISKKDLVRNKKATGRTQDKADAEKLE